MKKYQPDTNQQNRPILSLIHPDLIPPARLPRTSPHYKQQKSNHISLMYPDITPSTYRILSSSHRKQILPTKKLPPLYPRKTDTINNRIHLSLHNPVPVILNATDISYISHEIEYETPLPPDTRSRLRRWSHDWWDCI